MKAPGPFAERCPACGRPLALLWVHGHGQCATCGANVVPCCQGAGEEVPGPGTGRAPPVEQVIEILTRSQASLTDSSLLFELCRRTGCSFAAARQSLEGAVRTHRVRRQGEICSLAP